MAEKQKKGKKRKFTFEGHWHNIYFVANALIWAGLITMIFLLFPQMRFALRSSGWAIVVCSAVSITSSAVFLRPGRRIVGVVIQIVAWVSVTVLSFLLYNQALLMVLTLVLPAAVLSLGTLALLSSLTWRKEHHLRHAMRRS
ncbi:hypothetical protein JXM67_00160 [candidate division WOR-3 bacterium]|nr:hypothetical protein [candidate division WOR-3 bacterium]